MPQYNIVMIYVCDYRRGMDWILNLLTLLWTTSNYSAISDLHTTEPAKPFPSLLSSLTAVSCQRILTMEILQLPALGSSCHSLPCKTLVNCQLFLASLAELNCTANPQFFPQSKLKSKLLYEWLFTANQFVLTSSPLWLMTRIPPPP
jgi:hypothetical protein